MGARAKRWQLWVITMFILTGIIGVFQLFEGPKSIGAVTVAGGVANPSVGLPERSLEATQLPAWQPSGDASQSSETRTTTAAVKPVMASPRVAAAQTTHAAQVTNLPTATSTTVPVRGTTQAASTKAAVVVAKSVSASATVSSTKPAVTTTQPKATTTAPKPATTTAKATSSAPRPSQSVLKPTASATPTRTATQPRCYRVFIFWICR